MPSDLRGSGEIPAAGAAANPPLVIEPPSPKWLLRLFLIPFLIMVMIIGSMLLMSLFSKLAGSQPNIDQAIADLKDESGGQRTAEWFVGPAAKQRYIAATAIAEQIKAGMTQEQRIKLAADLLDILDHHTRPNEGDVEYWVLLALGRVWQVDSSQPPMNSPQAVESRQRVVAKLIEHARTRELYPKTAVELANLPDSALKDYRKQEMDRRKAAILALRVWKGRDEARDAFPTLISILKDGKEDLDVRMAAAMTLGPLANPADRDVIDALTWTMDNCGQDELIWDTAAALAQLNQPSAKPTILMLLDRNTLGSRMIDDVETGQRRQLTQAEQQRILCNTMKAARFLKLPEIKARLDQIAAGDPSELVRQCARDVLSGQADHGEQ